MALTREQKVWVLQEYIDLIKNTKWFWLVVQRWVWVNDMNTLRKQLHSTEWFAIIVRKRLFLMALDKAWIKWAEVWTIEWVCVFVWTNSDADSAAFSEVNNMNKMFKKEKKKDSSYKYLWWVYDSERKTGDYVQELATLPSKEELVGKFLFLLKYPIQSLTSVFDKIREKKEQE